MLRSLKERKIMMRSEWKRTRCPTLLFWTPEKAFFWFLKKKKPPIFFFFFFFNFWFFKKKPPKNCFFMFLLWFSFKNKRRTNVLLVGIFENTLKKAISRQKPKDKNNIWASIVFKAKAESFFFKWFISKKHLYEF